MHDLRMNALLERQRRGRVAQVMEADARQTGLLQERLEGSPPETTLADRAALRVGKDVSVCLPMTLGQLALAMLTQGQRGERRKIDLAARPRRLGVAP